jgi:hypothetical protein
VAIQENGTHETHADWAREAHLPRVETLEELDFAPVPRSRQSRSTNSAQLRYIGKD